MNKRIKDVLDAIKSVKQRAAKALAEGNVTQLAELNLDLIALHDCLRIECELAEKDAA